MSGFLLVARGSFPRKKKGGVGCSPATTTNPPKREAYDNSRTVEGVIELSAMKDLWLNRPKDTERCTEYENRWEQHKEWLHMVERPLYIDL